ncbi:MAG: hypothetical protein WBX25_23380 [Rhodomicrobium sp.]
MEVLTLLWTVLLFVLGIVWQVTWFILRDLVSSALWVLIAVWLVLSVRYRSFSAGMLTVLRYGGYLLRLSWRWLRGKPGERPRPPKEYKVQASKLRRKPFGTMSISEQLNMLLVGAICLLLLA